ncbi:MAG TPA: NAD(P)H-dependent oxidoreductase [Candidatus Bathyarchaeia archaeon]|nr:NAD(P)H-dependent oxidoreductase [Candidatus Bathyarchaeia archaeon]
MNVLMIYAHPNPKSFNHAIFETAQKKLQEWGHEVKVRDLYALDFDPVLSGSDLAGFRAGKTPDVIRAEQEFIAWAEVIVFIHPVWWTGLPAILKGYIDRVLSFGFAYMIDKGGVKGLLKGKKVVIINTTGSPVDYYQQIGMVDALKKTSDQGIYAFCGLEVIDHLFFGSVPSVSDEVRRQYLVDLERWLETAFKK